MSHDLYKLHMMAYEIEVLNAHLLAEVITQAEYDEKMKQFHCHDEICVEEQTARLHTSRCPREHSQ